MSLSAVNLTSAGSHGMWRLDLRVPVHFRSSCFGSTERLFSSINPPTPPPFCCLEWGAHGSRRYFLSQQLRNGRKPAFKFTLVTCRLTLHKFYRFWLKASRPLLRRSNFAHVNTNTALYAKIVTHHQQLSGKITSMLSRHQVARLAWKFA